MYPQNLPRSIHKSYKVFLIKETENEQPPKQRQTRLSHCHLLVSHEKADNRYRNPKDLQVLCKSRRVYGKSIVDYTYTLYSSLCNRVSTLLSIGA
jgi:hypothetical protein